MQSALEAQRILRWLVIVRWIALADLVLLIVLLVASFADNEELVQIFGLTHGIVFLALIAVVGIGGGPEALELVVSRWHCDYHRPSRRFGRGSPNCAQSQGHPRDIERGISRPIVDGLTLPSLLVWRRAIWRELWSGAPWHH